MFVFSFVVFLCVWFFFWGVGGLDGGWIRVYFRETKNFHFVALLSGYMLCL